MPEGGQAMTAKLIGYSRIASMNHQGNCAGTTRPARASSTARPKSEQVHGTTYVTRADAQAGLFEYIEMFYNRRRRHATLGHSSSVRILANWISKHAAQQSNTV